MKHTISCLVRDEPGVLATIAGSFGSLQININSLAVGTTAEPSVSRMTIVVVGSDEAVAQAEEIVRAMPNVIRLEDLASKEFFSRELLLVKVACPPESIGRIMQMAEMFDASVIGVSGAAMTLQLAAEGHRIDAMLRLLAPFTIRSMARSGRIAVAVEEE